MSLRDLIDKFIDTSDETMAHIVAEEYKIPQSEAKKLLEQESEYIAEKKGDSMFNNNNNNSENEEEQVVDSNVIEVFNIDMAPGKPTGDTFYGLPVLEDVGHALVPHLSHEYVRRELDGSRMDVEVCGRAMADPNFPTLLLGETGVGKNVLVKHLCEQTNRPMVRVNFGINTTYEKLIGLYVPDEENGGFTWRDGLLTKAVKNGWVFVADEINAAPPEVTVELNAVAEDAESRELFIQEKNELIKPHPEFRMVGTMNPSYAGTKDMNKAFKGRFYPFIVPHLPFNEMSPEMSPEVNIVTAKSNLGQHNDGTEIATRLVTLAHKLRQQADFETGQTLTTPISTRQLIQAGNLVCNADGKDFMSPKAAARIVFKGFADPFEWSTVDTVIDRHFPKES